MCLIILTGIGVFIIGELVSNFTIFRYIKNYFKESDIAKSGDSDNKKINKNFLFVEISTFKGVLERFVLFLALNCGFTPILVVFGALKLGTRLDNKNPVGNDYFLIGNFTSILIAILYNIAYSKILATIIFPG